MIAIMDALKRLFGISGNNTRHADVIASIAEESTRESKALNAQLREYSKHDDPFTAMMIDLHNRRTEMRIARRAHD